MDNTYLSYEYKCLYKHSDIWNTCICSQVFRIDVVIREQKKTCLHLKKGPMNPAKQDGLDLYQFEIHQKIGDKVDRYIERNNCTTPIMKKE